VDLSRPVTTQPLDAPPAVASDGSAVEDASSDDVAADDGSADDGSAEKDDAIPSFPLGYTRRKAITIDRTKVGTASPPAYLRDYPLLFSVTDQDLRTKANGGDVASAQGHDIIFRSMDGTTCGPGSGACALDHEIETYDGATGRLVAWVRVPRLGTAASSANSRLHVYYGSPGVTASTQEIRGVWDGDYAGVWHLNQDPAGTAPQIKDSRNLNHGKAIGGMTSGDLVAGQVGHALDFDGSDDMIDVGSDSSLDGLEQSTVCAWMNPRSYGQGARGRIYDKGNRFGLFVDDSAENMPDRVMHFFVEYSSLSLLVLSGANDAIRLAEWQHVCVTWDARADGSGARLYQNGTVTATHIRNTGKGSRNSDASLSAAIGGSLNALRAFDGLIDEVRVSRVVRTADWIQTVYANTSAPTSFFSVGPEELN
jgi:MSHA biogenesis protein MshQ